MAIKPEVLDALVAEGATAQMIAAAVKADALADERRQAEKRAKDAARQRKSRLSRNVTVTQRVPNGHAVTPRDTSPQVSPPRDINSTPSSSPSPSSLRSDVSAVAPKKPKPGDLDVLEILETCLSAETARDLVAHRKAKKSPMTAGAAKALAKSFAAFGDPEGAAQAMMANGWQGFNPEWMHNQARAGPAIPLQNDRRVYIGVDQQKQLLDEYYDRIEGKNREPAFKLIG